VATGVENETNDDCMVHGVRVLRCHFDMRIMYQHD
jgi:hypothetical protein